MTEPVVAIVQARMGSSRFPGKSLSPFAGSTLLEHILTRLGQAERGFDVVVATTDHPEDDAIVERCREGGIACFRGSPADVLERFAACVESLPAPPELVLRVCADRPLLCPRLVEELLDAYEELGRPDYLANNLPPSYPDGLDLELVRVEALLAARSDSVDPYEREHVTPFVYRRPERFRLAGLTCPFGSFADVRVALDTPEDGERLQRAHDALPSGYDYRDVLNLAALRPELLR